MDPAVQWAIDEVRRVVESKSQDYGRFDANFEDAARVAGTDPVGIALGMCQIKLARLSELRRRSGEAVHESRQDSMLDLAAYAILALAMTMPERQVE